MTGWTSILSVRELLDIPDNLRIPESLRSDPKTDQEAKGYVELLGECRLALDAHQKVKKESSAYQLTVAAVSVGHS